MENRSDSRKYCLISHTHWDREWYLPFENFRMRLVDLIDHLLDVLRDDPAYRFHLDAQTIVLEDYLAIRPSRRAELEAHIRAGRILVGPWYVQNDFHLTSGEATVRNLLIGRRIAGDFGGSMPVGYAADQFGLCSQLPQILARMGLDTCVFGRGFARDDSQFYWESEDGSRILCEHMFAWYNNAQRLPADPQAALRLLRMRGADCARKGKTSQYLMMNGVDHLEAQEDLTSVIDGIRPLLDPDEEVFQDTLPEYTARMKDEIAEKGLSLNTYTGEFRDLGAPNVLTGVLAARVHLKVWNASLQAMLEQRLEPLWAGAARYGVADFPNDYMTYLWKTLIQNHPHDSICGCSVDPVHEHMVDRFIRIKENADDLYDRGAQKLLSHVYRTGLDASQYLVMVVNSTEEDFGGCVKAVVCIPTAEDTGRFTLTDPKGKDVSFEVAAIERDVSLRVLSPINLPGAKRVNRYTLRLRPGKLRGMSHRVLVLTPVQGEPLIVTPDRRRSAYLMENDALRVRIAKNGTVTLTHKASGVTYPGLLAFEDNADRGTAYNYDENDDRPDELITSHGLRAAVSVVCDTPLCRKRKVALTLKPDRECGRGTVALEMLLTLEKGSPLLGVEITADNRCERHRLRVLIPTGIRTDHNYAGQPFDVLTREKVSRFADDRTHPFTDFVGVDAPDGSHGMAVMSCGLYEYEHQDASGGKMPDREGTLAVTLLRAFHRLTEDYAAEKTMDQTWVTPGGEIPGVQHLRLALYPYAGTRESARTTRQAKLFTAPPRALVGSVDADKFVGGRPFVQGPGLPDLFYRPLERPEKVVPREDTLFSITDESLPGAMILSAFKGAEDADGSLILRLWNSTSSEVDFSLRLGAPAVCEETDLGETPLRALPVVRRTVRLHAEAKRIITLRVRFKG